jgi:hypothetical protein
MLCKLIRELSLIRMGASSFITDAWFDMYLCNRDPLPININPQLTFHDDPIPGKNKQVSLSLSPSLPLSLSLSLSVY